MRSMRRAPQPLEARHAGRFASAIRRGPTEALSASTFTWSGSRASSGAPRGSPPYEPAARLSIPVKERFDRRDVRVRSTSCSDADGLSQAVLFRYDRENRMPHRASDGGARPLSARARVYRASRGSPHHRSAGRQLSAAAPALASRRGLAPRSCTRQSTNALDSESELVHQALARVDMARRRHHRAPAVTVLNVDR